MVETDLDRKIIIKYSINSENWVEGNIYHFHFQKSKCVHIFNLNTDWEEVRIELIYYDGLEIFGTFQGYSKLDNKSIWIIDLLQLKRDIILNKILPDEI